MKVAEFVAEILLKGSGKALQDVRKLSAGIKDMRLGLGAALNEFYKLTSAAREMAVSLDAYQVNTGLSAEQLQRLSFQASQAGVSMTELGSTIQKLQRMNANARLGYGWDPILSRFGLHPGQDPVTQLNQIGSALRRLRATNPAEASALANRVGLSDSMYYAMMRGTTEQMDEQLILTNKEQQALVKLNQQWNKLWFNLKQIGAKLQVLGAGLQTKFVKLLIEASQGFLNLVTKAKEFLDTNEKLKYAISALAVAVTAYLAPWLLTLGAIALVLQDIWVYFQGGDSVTGKIIDWVNQSERLKNTWQGIKIVFDGVLWVLNKIGTRIGEVVGFLNEHPKLTEALLTVGSKAVDAAGSVLSPGSKTLELLGQVSRNWGASVTQNNHTVVHVASTGDVAQDAKNVRTIQNELNQTQGQQAVRATGNSAGGLKYAPAQ